MNPENVEEFYRKDCQPGSTGFSETCGECVPEIGKEKPCSFSREKLITEGREKLRVLEAFGYKLPPGRREEALDFIEEYPVFVIKAGTTLCHSTHTHSILNFAKETETFITKRPHVGWWKKYFVGQQAYNGGWFTYETGYGGPKFGFLLHYRVLKDIPVLFVPNYAEYDREQYFDKKDIEELPISFERYTGSHLVQGVGTWKRKGYPKITPEYYADELAKRLVELGFPGYISCDECEVFLTHDSMQKGMYERPYRIMYELTENEEVKHDSIFHTVVSILCKDEDKCPLRIREGERNERMDIEILEREEIETEMPYVDFLQKYVKTFPEN